MPRGDGTGPQGMGPMTGRAAGVCGGYPVPGFMNPAPGRGAWGRGRGVGRGWGRGRGFAAWAPPAYGWPAYGAAPLAPEDEAETLKRQAEALQSQLGTIQKRIDELTAVSAHD